MNKSKLLVILMFVILFVFLLSIPATYIWGPEMGAILRWTGLGLGVLYFILRGLIKKEQ